MGQKDPAIEGEVKYRYNSVILHYRKSFIQDNAQRYFFSFQIFLRIVFGVIGLISDNCLINIMYLYLLYY